MPTARISRDVPDSRDAVPHSVKTRPGTPYLPHFLPAKTVVRIVSTGHSSNNSPYVILINLMDFGIKREVGSKKRLWQIELTVQYLSVPLL